MTTTQIDLITRYDDGTVRTTATGFRIQAIAPQVLERWRESRADAYGNHLTPTIDDEGGSPLRCCLRPAEPGARLLLAAYSPFPIPGPYAEVGPVFVHADDCPGYPTPDQYPPHYRDWPTMVFRPYRYSGEMAYDGLAKVDGKDAEAAIATMFADPTVGVIHARNVLAGCFMFAIHRPDAG